jgi:hypothetical protein
LHKETLYIVIDYLHELSGPIPKQYLQFVQRTRNDSPEDLPQPRGVIDRGGVRRELVPHIRDTVGWMQGPGNHQHTKPHGGQVDRGNIGGVMIALLLEETNPETLVIYKGGAADEFPKPCKSNRLLEEFRGETPAPTASFLVDPIDPWG